jgi:HEAT repeat protein
MLSSLSLLLAVTMSVQDATPAPSAKPRARRRAPPPVTAIAPFTMAPTPLATMGMTEAAVALEMASVELQSLTSIAPMAMVGPELAAAAYQLRAAPIALVSNLDEWDDVDEPDFTAADKVQGDAADSVYRAARQALNDNDYERAAGLFKSLRDKYPRSSHVPNTYYWQAFALYRAGSEDQLRAARAALQTQARRYPKATTRRDAEALLRRVEGSLAQLGDEDATASAIAAVDVAVPPVAAQPPQPAQPVATPRPGRPPSGYGPGRPEAGSRDDRCNDDDDDDIRIAALNAVLQMDADRAVPLLKTVLARRDEGSACLRRKAVFLVSQKRSDETSRILLDAVRNDPDKEVREQAVFWLSQVPGDETVAALDSILQDPKSDPEIQEKAIFALSQHRSPRAAAILCTYSGRSDRPAELREKSIFWLGQRRSPENQQCLRDLYKKLDSDDLKEKVIFSLSQMGGADNYRWLMDIALNARENIELRKKALFWAGQGRSVDVADLVRLYDSMNDREMKEQLIFVYSQRREEAALDKLFQIGKTDPDRELRKKAIFWIGQSRSPRAAQYLQDLINQ